MRIRVHTTLVRFSSKSGICLFVGVCRAIHTRVWTITTLQQNNMSKKSTQGKDIEKERMTHRNNRGSPTGKNKTDNPS